MAQYRILVVDDQWKTNKRYYQLLLDCDDFQWEFASSQKAFEEANLEAFDAVILDINLDSNGWDMPLVNAAGVIRNRRPVVLVSQYWAEGKTHDQVSKFVASRRDAYVIQTMTLEELGGTGWEDRVAGLRERLQIAIAQHQRRGMLSPAKDDALYILHISDPQYGDPGEDNWAFLTEHFITKHLDNQLHVSPHFLVITGDITYSGMPEEYERAGRELKKLVKRLWPVADDRLERILLVPGNHDVNLRLSAADHVNFDFKSKTVRCRKTKNSLFTSYGLYPFRDFAYRLTNDPRWKDSADLCWTNDSFRHAGLRFFLLNSASEISCLNPELARISHEALDRLAGEVSCTNDNNDLFGIVISHHGPAVAGDALSLDQCNWPKVSNFLSLTRTKLFLHGHGHARMARWLQLGNAEPTVTPENFPNHDNDIIQVMAPTTHLDGHLRRENERRGFNLIEVKRSGGKVYKLNNHPLKRVGSNYGLKVRIRVD